MLLLRRKSHFCSMDGAYNTYLDKIIQYLLKHNIHLDNYLFMHTHFGKFDFFPVKSFTKSFEKWLQFRSSI